MSSAPKPIDRWIDAIANIRSSLQRGGRRAPYKPLVLLWAIGRSVQGETMPVSYEDAEGPLKELLKEFAVSDTTPNVADPFVRLRSDPPGPESNSKLWVLKDANRQLSNDNDKVVRSLSPDATGDLTDDFKQLLKDGRALREVVAALLKHIPEETLHPTILTLTGLHQLNGPTRTSRDQQVVKQVRAAYGFRCAFCGFDAEMFGTPKALVAAHIQPMGCDGPDEVTNCLLLCSLHHDLFDVGALAVDCFFSVQVSNKLKTDDMHARMISIALNGRQVNLPSCDNERPSPQQLQWHREHVFKGEPVPRC